MRPRRALKALEKTLIFLCPFRPIAWLAAVWRAVRVTEVQVDRCVGSASFAVRRLLGSLALGNEFLEVNHLKAILMQASEIAKKMLNRSVAAVRPQCGLSCWVEGR